MSKLIGSYKDQEEVKNYDQLYPEGMWHINDDDFCVCFISCTSENRSKVKIFQIFNGMFYFLAFLDNMLQLSAINVSVAMQCKCCYAM